MQFWLFSALVFGPLVTLQFIVQMILSFPSVDLSGGQGAIRTASLDANLFESVAIIGTVNLVLHMIGALLPVTAEIGSVAGRESVCEYGETTGVVVSLTIIN